MIGQIGGRYEGDVALTADPENINSMGMLALYETLFRRAAEFSIDQGINNAAANRTLLFASSRLATLYTLLGNEAYDPRDWSGMIRFVAFYTRVLTAAEVWAAAGSLPAGSPPLGRGAPPPAAKPSREPAGRKRSRTEADDVF